MRPKLLCLRAPQPMRSASQPGGGSNDRDLPQGCRYHARSQVRQLEIHQLASGQKRRRTRRRPPCEIARHVKAWQFHIIFVSVNAITAGRRSRTRDAIGAVRHVLVDADCDGAMVLSRVEERDDLPDPSYVLHSSPNRVHLFWRVRGFDHDSVERLQKQLASELRTDPAATPVTQNTRVPGFFSHKRREPHLVTIEYRNVDVRYRPDDFPPLTETSSRPQPIKPREPRGFDLPILERAKRYLASVPPAIAGQHGDVHTFRVCCRLTRGFALDDEQALHVLSEWNARCQPPWSEAELLDKLRRAARYGREQIGGLV
jgi:RepB DNA-primase N-terminal domain